MVGVMVIDPLFTPVQAVEVEVAVAVNEVPAATAILDRFLHHAFIITMSGRSYRLRHGAQKLEEETQETKESGPSNETKKK